MIEIMTSWKEEGLLQGEKNLMLRQLTRRFGKLTVGVQEQIGALSVAQVGELGEALLDFSAIADLTGWLEQHTSTEEAQ